MIAWVKIRDKNDMAQQRLKKNTVEEQKVGFVTVSIVYTDDAYILPGEIN